MDSVVPAITLDDIKHIEVVSLAHIDLPDKEPLTFIRKLELGFCSLIGTELKVDTDNEVERILSAEHEHRLWQKRYDERVYGRTAEQVSIILGFKKQKPIQGESVPASEVKARVDIVNIIDQVVHLKPSGTRKVGLCPFHNEKTGSLVVFPETQTWHCYGCSLGGDCFTWIQKLHNCSFKEALVRLATNEI